MHTRLRSPRARAVVAVAVALGVGAATAPNASAYVPAEHLLRRVEDVHRQAQYDPNLYAQLFANAHAGPDGIPGPDGTPDGLGAFQWFDGPGGRAAIYTMGGAGSYLRGAILDHWAASGWETGYGYPLFPERANIQFGLCNYGDTGQLFHNPVRNDYSWICFSWSSGIYARR